MSGLLDRMRKEEENHNWALSTGESQIFWVKVGPKRHSLSSLPFQRPKKSRFSGPTLSNGPRNGYFPPQNHYVPRHINNKGTLILIMLFMCFRELLNGTCPVEENTIDSTRVRKFRLEREYVILLVQYVKKVYCTYFTSFGNFIFIWHDEMLNYLLILYV
jgi:hypothetical protein